MIHFTDTDNEIEKSFDTWKKRHAAHSAEPGLLLSAYIAGLREGCKNYMLMPQEEAQEKAAKQTQLTHIV